MKLHEILKEMREWVITEKNAWECVSGSEEWRKCCPRSPAVLWFVNAPERKPRLKKKAKMFGIWWVCDNFLSFFQITRTVFLFCLYFCYHLHLWRIDYCKDFINFFKRIFCLLFSADLGFFPLLQWIYLLNSSKYYHRRQHRLYLY